MREIKETLERHGFLAHIVAVSIEGRSGNYESQEEKIYSRLEQPQHIPDEG
jgi:hypothetical protein